MSVDLAGAAADYLADRRARGHRLADHDYLIRAFLDGLDARGVTTITVSDSVAFALQPNTTARWHAVRLQVVRGLAAYVHRLDGASAELIPPGLIAFKVTRRIPYLYSQAQIGQLMAGTATLGPPHLAATVRTLIGLLAATGLRGGEAAALNIEDVRADEAVMTVTGKNGRQRLVPLHPSTLAALDTYRRSGPNPTATTGPLLVGGGGGRLNMNTARAAFRTVATACDLPTSPGCGPPRLHDLRHLFAVNSLIDAHRNGVDIDARIATLAVYLGHADPTNTYWYLTASAELMTIVAARVTAHHTWEQP